ncbi:2-hydroxycyclohexanecarboxyl-CoA dehydrogenase [Desulfotomaculum arcticum]|uniref:2-hydroxycyclohexanecarboxyl-CoA dehydrogenase n=1 Tax=Desulfotruncus arcticus DSM 17038 TaxID=1121424 RepID=A0A1I2XWA9_9FIRM|nr:3-oxoacyl-ACP reductase family protein [Desulfotruncus arcticus]SFH17016.1 2-hydroxycyclohexanecarboxyl-CoA dehydrogenase [Desulfotomaculum arcticum] [Desulfotruncus arcticus DSM 17038]
MRLDGTNIIVTGAGQGIGKAIALKLASYGADLSIADKNPETLLTTRAEIEQLGRKCVAVPTDVTDFESVTAMVKEFQENLGQISVLVNTVGWDIIEPFWKNSLEYWDKIIDINYKSVVYCSRAVLDSMMENKAGKIINIASDAGRGGSSGETVYAGAKGGVIAFTKSLAREVAKFNIKVNCVCPGPTDTPLYRGQPQKIREALERAIPLRRVASPDDIAGAALYFASDLADYVTGQTISVSGGLTMYG